MVLSFFCWRAGGVSPCLCAPTGGLRPPLAEFLNERSLLPAVAGLAQLRQRLLDQVAMIVVIHLASNDLAGHQRRQIRRLALQIAPRLSVSQVHFALKPFL